MHLQKLLNKSIEDQSFFKLMMKRPLSLDEVKEISSFLKTNKDAYPYVFIQLVDLLKNIQQFASKDTKELFLKHKAFFSFFNIENKEDIFLLKKVMHNTVFQDFHKVLKDIQINNFHLLNHHKDEKEQYFEFALFIQKIISLTNDGNQEHSLTLFEEVDNHSLETLSEIQSFLKDWYNLSSLSYEDAITLTREFIDKFGVELLPVPPVILNRFLLYFNIHDDRFEKVAYEHAFYEANFHNDFPFFPFKSEGMESFIDEYRAKLSFYHNEKVLNGLNLHHYDEYIKKTTGENVFRALERNDNITFDKIRKEIESSLFAFLNKRAFSIPSLRFNDMVEMPINHHDKITFLDNEHDVGDFFKFALAFLEVEEENPFNRTFSLSPFSRKRGFVFQLTVADIFLLSNEYLRLYNKEHATTYYSVYFKDFLFSEHLRKNESRLSLFHELFLNILFFKIDRGSLTYADMLTLIHFDTKNCTDNAFTKELMKNPKVVAHFCDFLTQDGDWAKNMTFHSLIHALRLNFFDSKQRFHLLRFAFKEELTLLISFILNMSEFEVETFIEKSDEKFLYSLFEKLIVY